MLAIKSNHDCSFECLISNTDVCLFAEDMRPKQEWYELKNNLIIKITQVILLRLPKNIMYIVKAKQHGVTGHEWPYSIMTD